MGIKKYQQNNCNEFTGIMMLLPKQLLNLPQSRIWHERISRIFIHVSVRFSRKVKSTPVETFNLSKGEVSRI